MKKLIFIFLIAGFIAGCSKSKSNDYTEATKAEYNKNELYFSLPSMDGGVVKLDDYKGKAVMIMFFTENCPYCIKASGFVESIYKKYNDKIGVIGISVRNYPESPKNFKDKTGVSFPLLYDGRDVAKRYGIAGVPFIYLLDKEHNLLKVWAGYSEEYNSSIEDSISKVI